MSVEEKMRCLASWSFDHPTLRGAHLAVALLSFSYLLFPAVALAQPHTCGPGTVPEFGRWFVPDITPLTGSHLSETIDPPDLGSGVSAVKLLIAIDSKSAHEWNLVLRDSDYRVLATAGPSDFPSNTSSTRWTGILRAKQVIVDLIASTDSDIRVTISEAIAFPASSTGRLFSLVNPGHPWQELYGQNKSSAAKRAGDAVGMLVGAYSDGTKSTSWCCSGVMISADVMLTNWHCGGSIDLKMESKDYWSPDICANTAVDLNWAKGATSKKYGCMQVLAADQDLDFAAIRLGPLLGPDGAVGEPVHARLSLTPQQKGEDVFIVHHSQCLEKLVSSSCQVKTESYPGWQSGSTTSNLTEFTHNCNVETGASGAPVFDVNGDVIGLHHLGAETEGAACTVTVGENKAIKISEILKFIWNNNQKFQNLVTELGLKGKDLQ